MPGALEAVRRLRHRGFRLGIVSDTGFRPGRVLRRQLSEVGILDCFEPGGLAFSDEVGVPKPDPRIFERALSGLDVTAAEAVHVGDLKFTDVAGARSAGMRVVRFTGCADDLEDGPEADAVISSHAELEVVAAPSRSDWPSSAQASAERRAAAAAGAWPASSRKRAWASRIAGPPPRIRIWEPRSSPRALSSAIVRAQPVNPARPNLERTVGGPQPSHICSRWSERPCRTAAAGGGALGGASTISVRWRAPGVPEAASSFSTGRLRASPSSTHALPPVISSTATAW